MSPASVNIRNGRLMIIKIRSGEVLTEDLEFLFMLLGLNNDDDLKWK